VLAAGVVASGGSELEESCNVYRSGATMRSSLADRCTTAAAQHVEKRNLMSTVKAARLLQGQRQQYRAASLVVFVNGTTACEQTSDPEEMAYSIGLQ